MSKYTELDELIIAAIVFSSDTFTLLQQHLAVAHAARSHDTGTGFDRVIDRRLQALRKAGKIRYEHGKWEVVE